VRDANDGVLWPGSTIEALLIMTHHLTRVKTHVSYCYFSHRTVSCEPLQPCNQQQHHLPPTHLLDWGHVGHDDLRSVIYQAVNQEGAVIPLLAIWGVLHVGQQLQEMSSEGWTNVGRVPGGKAAHQLHCGGPDVLGLVI